MGVFGWLPLNANVTFAATVVEPGLSFSGGLGGDGDWSLFVCPDDQKWMVNSHGHRNCDNWVECEVQPPGNFPEANGMGEATERRFLQPFLNQRVTVGGTWCEDISHDSKPELPPLDFVLLDPSVTPGIARRPRFI